uniref:Uncharacterized protein n=1 Tax=Anopheles atroparvus TaxID=41427 RepID=A0A182J7J8_ANOAO
MARQFSEAPPWISSRLSGCGLPMPPPSDQSFWLRTVVGASFCSSAVQNQPFTLTVRVKMGPMFGNFHESNGPTFHSRAIAIGLTRPSTILALIHSFSGLVSTDTLSMQRWRQKFRASSQSFSTPRCVGSRQEKKYL